MAATRWASEQRPGVGGAVYPFSLDTADGGTVIRLQAFLEALLAAREAGASPGEIGWRFHATLSEMIVRVCRRVSGPRTVVLSGGCFQNRLLLYLVVPRLESAGFRVLLHRQVPCNDGGLSLGQAVLAHWIQSEAE
jgi:hydrogenase maturation protein HypF